MDTGILYYGGLMKRIALATVLVVGIFLVINSSMNIEETPDIADQVVWLENKNNYSRKHNRIDIYKIANMKYSTKINELYSADDKKQWFVEYKEMINKYSGMIDSPETIYDCYSDEELRVLFGVVEAEIGIGDFDNKVNIANVIFNRCEDDRFPSSLTDVLCQQIDGIYQFSTIANNKYRTVDISEETILACEYAFEIGDTTNAIWFDSTKGNSWASYNRSFIMNDGYHDFYK